MKIIKLIKPIALVFLVSIALFSCSSKDDGDPINPVDPVNPVDPPTIKVKSVSLNKTVITKIVGETEQLTATVNPSDATNKTVTWKSSNDEIASVDVEGKLTAKKEGIVIISVNTKDGNKSDECTVTVKAASPYIHMQTTTDKVSLWIDAAEADRPNCWIDLNDNSQRDKGEDIVFAQNKTYDSMTQAITIYGKITHLNASSNLLTKLDISNNKNLEHLWCKNNLLTKLDISKNTKLQYINCSINRLNKLDISKNTQLEKLNCSTNRLTTLDLSNKNKLKEINCRDNQLTKLDLSKNTKLEKLNCFKNKLTELDLSKNTKLEIIECINNKLTQLDVSHNTALEVLMCSSTNLSKLNLSKNTNLVTLWCDSNQLTKLDLSKNTKLENINCHENKVLKSLNLANGKNASVLIKVNAAKCPSLSCIQIDKGFTPNKNWHKDLAAKWNNSGTPCQ